LTIVLTRSSKQAARYTDAGGRERCSACRFFMPQGTCGRIIGPVSPRGWCRFFSQEMVQRQPQGAIGIGGPSLDISFGGPTLDPRLTFTRASTATYFNAAGTLQTAATNAARFDYDPVTLALRGLLIEEQRTNLILQSQFAASWTPSDASITANQVQSPDGGITGAVLQEGGSVGIPHYIVQSLSKAASSITYAVSVYVKAGVGSRNLQFQIDDGSANGISALVNPATGAIVTGITTIGAGWSGASLSYSAINNGWGRFAFTVTTAATTTLRTILFMANGASISYNGDNTSNIRMYGFQIEQGAFATSYIPTTAAAVTRSVDYCTMPSANMGWYVSPGGSWFAEFIGLEPPASISVKTARVVCQAASGGVAPLWLQGLPLSQFDGAVLATANNVLAPNIVNKGASTWAPGSAKTCLNAGVIASGSLPNGYPQLPGSGIAFLASGSGITAESLTGYIRRVRYWPRVLSNSELQAVTDNSAPTIDLDFTKMTLDPMLTFARASTATYFNAAGTMQTAATNSPRFDYDPVTHAALGLLVEDQRTNVALYSANLVGAAWAGGGSTITAGQPGAPDGTATVARIAETATTGLHYTIQNPVSTAATGMYTVSLYAKAAEVRYLQVSFDDSGSGTVGGYATFDVQAGVISGPLTAYGGATIGGASIQSVGNGWYRCSISATHADTPTGRLLLALSNIPTPGFSPSYLGNASNGLLLWGAQIESGAFATSYIPTTAAAVTRAQDWCGMPTGAWFNATQGSMVAQFLNESIIATGNFYNSGLFALDDGASNRANGIDFMGFLNSATFSQPNFNINVASASTGAISYSNLNLAGRSYSGFGCSWNATTAAVCANGGTVQTTAVTGLPPGINRLTLGSGYGGILPLSGWLRRARYWPRVLSNSELQSVTT
jgi:hypothetical protein